MRSSSVRDDTMTSPTHAMAAVALAAVMAPRSKLRLLAVIGAACAVMPDLDLLAPAFGGSRDFHRTVTHSLTVALLAGLGAGLVPAFARLPTPQRLISQAYLALATASHAALDMLTTYPMGVALFSPFSGRRYYSPWRPVASVGQELMMVFVPALIVALLVLRSRRRPRPSVNRDVPAPGRNRPGPG